MDRDEVEFQELLHDLEGMMPEPHVDEEDVHPHDIHRFEDEGGPCAGE